MSSEAAGPVSRTGPHRSESVRQAVLDAADDLLVEHGFAGVTMEGIATRAGVAKQTVYRWWKSKVDILLDNLEEDGTTALAWEPGDGDPTETLTRHLHRVVGFLTNEPAGQVLRSLIGHAQHDATTATRIREGFLAAQRERDLAGLAEVLRRSGRVCSDDEVARCLDRLLGPVYYRVLVLGTTPGPTFVTDLVHDALPRDATDL